MICQHCGAYSCPDGGNPLGNAPPQLYCDAQCKRNARCKRAMNSPTSVARTSRRRRKNAAKSAWKERAKIRPWHAASCERKQRFATQKDAERELAAPWRRKLTPDSPGGVYACLECAWWHVTSQEIEPDRVAMWQPPEDVRRVHPARRPGQSPARVMEGARDGRATANGTKRKD